VKDTLARLVGGEPPKDERERKLLRAWNALEKLERYAVAAKWDLPYTPQAKNATLATNAEKKLQKAWPAPKKTARKAAG
jgi:hypothetical protein